jgi:uncharacterized protein
MAITAQPEPSVDWLIDLHDMPHRTGDVKQVQRSIHVSDGWGTEMIQVDPDQPITLDLTVETVGEGVLVRGQVDFALTGRCARCLNEITDEDSADINQLYLWELSESTGDDDEDFGLIERDQINLEPEIRDAIILDLPLAPLCRDNCSGLCPRCGANLNDDPDHRHEDLVDERWAKLKELSVTNEQEEA